MYVFRKVFLHLFHTLIHCVCNVNVVGSRLGNDNDSYHRYTVHFHIALDIGGSKFGPADVAEADDLISIMLDDQIVEHFGRTHQSHGTDVQFYGISFYATRRQFNIFIVHCIFYVHRRDTVAGHFDGVEPQTHGIFFLSPNGNTTYVGNRL